MSATTVILIVFLYFVDINCKRLDRLIEPKHYDLILLPVIAGDRPQLCGHVTLDFRVRSATNVLTFHSANLNLISVEVTAEKNLTESDTKGHRDHVEDLCFLALSDSNSKTVQFVHSDQSEQQVSIVTRTLLYPDVNYQLTILYTGQVRNDDTNGFFRGTYTDPGSCCQRWFGATQMEVAHARKVLPCLDEPEFKATFKITLGHERNMKALANMPDIATIPMTATNGWAWTEFAVTPRMATYILAFVITDFEHSTVQYVASDNRTVDLRFWTRPGRLQEVRHSMEAVPKIIRFLENYLEEPITLPKIDFYSPPIAIRNFLAMENWGLILFKEENYYFDAEKGDRMEGFDILQVLAHELAHQYFGNLVTSDWWSDIWLNEGFAGFFEFVIAENVLTSYKREYDRNRAEGAINAHRIDELQAKGHPVVFPVATPEEAEQNFGILSYAKGNVLLRMLQFAIGHENFRKGLVNYFDEFKFKNANSTDLWDVMSKQLQRDRRVGSWLNVREIMESWTLQPSYPIIKCYRTSNGRISLSQERFPHNPKDFDFKPWWVPLNIANGRTADFSPKGMSARLWLTPQRQQVEIGVTIDNSIGPLDNATWVLINGEFTAYTRVDYDELNWHLLSQQLKNNHSRIPMLSRVKLIDDAFTLGVNGMTNFGTPLDMIDYLATNYDEHVLPTALRHLRDIKAVIKTNDSLVNLLQENIDRLTKVKPSIELNELARSANRAEDKLSRTNCESKDKICIDRAVDLYNSVNEGSATENEERLLQEEFDWIGCAAIRNGGDKEWRFAWKQSLTHWKNSREKIYRAMGCSKNEKLIQQLLSRVFQSTVEQQPEDTQAIISNLADSPSRSIAMSFLMENWEFLEKHLKHLDGPLKLLDSITAKSSASKELNKVADFLRTRSFNGKTAALAQNIIETMRQNVEFLKTRSDHLYRALSNKKHHV